MDTCFLLLTPHLRQQLLTEGRRLLQITMTLFAKTASFSQTASVMKSKQAIVIKSISSIHTSYSNLPFTTLFRTRNFRSPNDIESFEPLGSVTIAFSSPRTNMFTFALEC